MWIRTVLCLMLVLPASGAFAKSCGKGHIADDKECHVDKPPASHEHKGKKCGNGYISKDKECHIGQEPVKKTPEPVPVAKEPAKIPPAVIVAPVAAAAAAYTLSKPAEQPVVRQKPEPPTEIVPTAPYIALFGGLIFWWRLRRAKRALKQ